MLLLQIWLWCVILKSYQKYSQNVERIGVIVISSRENCANCRGRLNTRPDRVTSAVIYDHAHGTIPALHSAKYCHKFGCYFHQHYGYHTVDDSSSISYDSDWLELLYFMASRERAFSLAYLRQFDVHCLIRQISYKQAAEKYNCYNGYEWSDSNDRWILRLYCTDVLWYMYIMKELCLLACQGGHP